jgi:hypothetical protein
MSKLQIAKVQILNTLGIKELEFDAGKFVEITAKNGLGKTSVLDAIKSVFEGGNDATLIHKGEERSEIVLVLSDRTTIRKRTTGSTTAVTVEKDGQRMAKPQETINALRDMISVNPVEFLTQPAKKRLSTLLETMPMTVDVERVRTIIGQADYELDGEYALEQLDAAHASVFTDRRDTNRSATQKVATIDTLAATLPKDGAIEGLEEGVTEEMAEQRLRNVDEAWQAESERIDTKLGGLKETHDAEVALIREQIATLQTRITEQVTAFAELQGRAGQQRQISETRWRDDRAAPLSALELIRANRDGVSRAAQTRETMKAMRAEADALERDSEKMTKALKALEAYKAELLADLPIPGLTVEDGVLMRDGVVFDRLNKAQQVEIAVAIAKLRAGDLGVVCVDDFERLDTEHREALIAQLAESDLQLFVTRVSDGALTITTT